MLANASYSSRVTRRPAFSLRVVPRKSTDAPAAGSATAARSRAGSMRAAVISNGSATAHRREERDLVAVGQDVIGLHVALVDGVADADPGHRRVRVDERLPERAGRRSCRDGARLSRAQPLAQRGEESQLDLRHTQLLTRSRMCDSTGTSSFPLASPTAAVEPGSDTMTVRPATPATARDSIAAGPISAKDSERNSSPNPSRRLSRRATTASYVVSRRAR